MAAACGLQAGVVPKRQTVGCAVPRAAGKNGGHGIVLSFRRRAGAQYAKGGGYLCGKLPLRLAA